MSHVCFYSLIYIVKKDRQTFYEGYWEDGVQMGPGRMIFPNGSVLVGNFNNGLLNGEGKCRDQQGNIFKGNFKNGKLEGIIQIVKIDGGKLLIICIRGIYTTV